MNVEHFLTYEILTSSYIVWLVSPKEKLVTTVVNDTHTYHNIIMMDIGYIH